MITTKEELLRENGTLQAKLDAANARDAEMRREFAKAFSWTKSRGAYQEDEPSTPTWHQIFREIGKLQVNDKNLSYQYRFDDLSMAVEDIQRRLQDFPID